MPDLFDAAASREARDQAIDLTSKRNSEWLKDYLEFIRNLPAKWTGTGEDIRAVAPIHAPDDPHAWGAGMVNAVRLGLLVKTGRYLPMKDKKSHARATPEYRKAT